MLTFRRVELSDKDCVTAQHNASPDRGCEYTFGNIFIWRDVYNTKVAFTDDDLCVIRFDSVVQAYLFPFGTGSGLKSALDDMLADARALGRPFMVIAAAAADKDAMHALYPGRFKEHTSRDFAEYVYNSEDLIELRGKKYHGKRNHIAHFLQSYPDYTFTEIARDNIAAVREMNERWYVETMAEYGDASLAEERIASANAFDHYFELGFSGGFLTAGGSIVAFSMGEAINPETFCVHIEKACYDADGAYTVINRDFAAHFCQNYKYINREDDVGDEGLRRAKLSYNPAILTEKYVVTEL